MISQIIGLLDEAMALAPIFPTVKAGELNQEQGFVVAWIDLSTDLFVTGRAANIADIKYRLVGADQSLGTAGAVRQAAYTQLPVALAYNSVDGNFLTSFVRHKTLESTLTYATIGAPRPEPVPPEPEPARGKDDDTFPPCFVGASQDGFVMSDQAIWRVLPWFQDRDAQ